MNIIQSKSHLMDKIINKIDLYSNKHWSKVKKIYDWQKWEQEVGKMLTVRGTYHFKHQPPWPDYLILDNDVSFDYCWVECKCYNEDLQVDQIVKKYKSKQPKQFNKFNKLDMILYVVKTSKRIFTFTLEE